MQYTDFQQAILRLKEQFPSLDWSPKEITVGGQTELIYHWPGTCREDIIICCHQSEFEREPFHRHDFFYFNYTYQGQYDSISCKYDRKITVCENELYAGQPFAGHALSSAFLIQIARQYGTQLSAKPPTRLADQFYQYMNRHSDSVTLKELSDQFSYHPNYISAVLNKEFGIPFSKLLLRMRMERALALMKGTSLPLEQIASLVGYSNSSNFYKAFRDCFHASPREYLARLNP